MRSRAKIMPTRSVLYESGHITVYYRIDASNRLLMGGRGPMQLDQGSCRRSAYLMRYAERLWPGIQRRAMDARLEQPPRHHARPLSASA